VSFIVIFGTLSFPICRNSLYRATHTRHARTARCLPVNPSPSVDVLEHRHRIDKYLDTLLASQTARKASKPIISKIAIARWRTAPVIISTFLPLPNQSQRGRSSAIANAVSSAVRRIAKLLLRWSVEPRVRVFKTKTKQVYRTLRSKDAGCVGAAAWWVTLSVLYIRRDRRTGTDWQTDTRPLLYHFQRNEMLKSVDVRRLWWTSSLLLTFCANVLRSQLMRQECGDGGAPQYNYPNLAWRDKHCCP